MDPPPAPPQAPKASKKKRSSQQIGGTNTQNDLGENESLGAAAGDHEPGDGPASAASTFRNVSACNRCRLRKNRCDQKLPACTSCEKARVRCVGYDPVSKREIPRSYVYYLESRVQQLESILQSNNIACPAAEDLTISLAPPSDVDAPDSSIDKSGRDVMGNDAMAQYAGDNETALSYATQSQEDNSTGPKGVDVQGISDPRSLGPKSGISFASVVFAAVKSSVSHTPSERGGSKSSKPFKNDAAAGGSTMRDSIFGLHAKPTIKPAPFPDMALARRLVDLYFEHANPQIPTLHRGEYMGMMERVFAAEESKRRPRELFMLNIVFAIGSGIIMDSSDSSTEEKGSDTYGSEKNAPPRKKQKTAGQQHQPEEYHAAAVQHLDSFSGSPPAVEAVGPGLEELQAVLLLAGFALLRPVAPGLWYIVGVAVRLAVDLGLHFEDQDSPGDLVADPASQNPSKAKTLGKRQWMRDLRRRLWWCVYSFDRLVSICVGRPVCVDDQVVTSEFPSLLEDVYITTSGFVDPPAGLYGSIPSYKQVSHHYFRLRLIQSEILQVLQHRQAQLTRATGINQDNRYMHTTLPSPFLAGFMSFRDWRIDIDRRLWEWKESAPTQSMTGVQFTPLFLELNYWQAVVMLYRQSLSVPAPLAGELDPSTTDDVQSPGHVHAEVEEDEEMVFLKVAEAGQRVLRIYRQLHRVHLVNYTYLATHHLFMCGISFLYAIWHSPLVRSKLTLDDVDFTVLAATSVLGDLIEKCPPAEACRDAFKRMSKATISMCMSTTGFGAQAMKSIGGSNGSLSRHPNPGSRSNLYSEPQQQQRSQMMGNIYAMNPQQGFGQHQSRQDQRRPAPRFDMELKDLFSEDDLAIRSPSLNRGPMGSSGGGASQDRFIKVERSNAGSVLGGSGVGTGSSGSPWQMIPQPSQQQNQQNQQQQQSPIDPALQMQGSTTASQVSGSPMSTTAGGGYQNLQLGSGNGPSVVGGGGNMFAADGSAEFGPLDFMDEWSGHGQGVVTPGGVSGVTSIGTAEFGNAIALNGGNGTLDWDLGFGAGGLAFDGGAGGSWDQDGFDLFGGFFFGNGNGGGSGNPAA